MNPVKQKLASGKVALGQIVLELFTPGVGPMLAASGMEFVLYDMEHGRCDLGLLESMVISCRGSNIVPLCRVPDINSAPISRVLDLGVKGVMVPRIETRDQMETAVSALKYAPEGKRGVALGVAHDLYRAGAAEFLPKANEDTLVIALIETVKGMENIDQILSVPGVDVAWMGHYDLTVSMGIPAQFTHPRFLAAMDTILEATSKRGMAAGFMAGSPEDAVYWISKGFRAISVGSDIITYMTACRNNIRAVATAIDARHIGVESPVH